MSPRRTRANTAMVEKSTASTRYKTPKISNVNENMTELIRQTRGQLRKKENSLDIKDNFQVTPGQSAKTKSYDTMIILRKSARKNVSHKKLNLIQETEAENKFAAQNSNTDTNKSIKILRDRHNKISVVEFDLSQSNASKDLDSNETPNKKFQQKTINTDIKNMPVIVTPVTPKSTPPKLSLTPHRSKKTPKKSPISLSSPKTHSITVPKLFKSPRKLSLITSEENLNKSYNKSHNEKLEKATKDNYSISNKSLSISSLVTKSKRKKSDNLKIIHKFSKSPKIVLRSPKSKKSKSHKLKLLSPSQKVRNNSSKTFLNITSDASPDIDLVKTKFSAKRSLTKEKDLSRIKRQLIKAVSQKKDMLAEPIVLLERLSPERIQNILKITNKIQSDTSIIIKSPLIDTGDNFKEFTTFAGSDTSINQNSNTKLRSREKLVNRVSPRIKYTTPIKDKDRSSITLMSSTPQEENILINMNLTPNTSIINIDNTSLNISSKHKNQFDMSNMMYKNTTIENISKPSIFDSDPDQSHISNVMKGDVIYNKDSLIMLEKEQENKDCNTYELEQPQTLSLQQIIKKNISTNENLSYRENGKKAKVHFADEKLDTSNVHKSINKSIGLQPKVLLSNDIHSVHKLKKVEIARFNQNSLVSPLKIRTSPRTNIVTPRVQLSRIQVTPKTFTLTEKKSEKKSSTKKVPNFGKIHEQMFAKSESLVDAKKRLETRHLTFTTKKILTIDAKKKETRPLPTDTKNGTHNRFGFKLRKNQATHIMLTKQTTFSREKQQHETRMALKGVRMNRRFELQMKARNLKP